MGADTGLGSRIPRAFSLLINARGESVNDKPAFRKCHEASSLASSSRLTAFYEWNNHGGRKRPYCGCDPSRQAVPIAFAGAVGKSWIGPKRRGGGNGGHHHQQEAKQWTCLTFTTGIASDHSSRGV